MAVISPFLILSFYAVLGGMVLRYCLGFLVQIFGATASPGRAAASSAGCSGQSMILFFALFLVCTMAIVMGGVQGGIEKFSKAVMPALGIILIGIIIFVAMQPGALEGYKFMFKPDMSLFSSPGSFFDVLKTASGQVFFLPVHGHGHQHHLRLLPGQAEELLAEERRHRAPVRHHLRPGRYDDPARLRSLPRGLRPRPGLLFASMQKVFLDGMGGQAGNIIGFLFFYFLVFIAAVTSSIALMEVLTSAVVDRQLDKGKEPNRKKTALLFAVLQFLIGIPVAWTPWAAAAPWSRPLRAAGPDDRERHFAMWNDCWLDFYDMLTEGIMMMPSALCS